MIKRLKFLGLTILCVAIFIAGVASNLKFLSFLAFIGWFVGLFFIARAEYKAEKNDRELKNALLEERKNKNNN